jgi:putative Holliday junction resolvase
MRHLGIDYGEKHIGIAVSNEDGTMAFPHATLSNGPELLGKIAEIVEQKEVKKIVIGESKNFQGKDNSIMERARAFASALEDKVSLPVHFEPEFMTSVEARHIQGGGEKTHASAASLILKSYFDRKAEEEDMDRRLLA